MANTSTLAGENKTESNLEKFELSRSGRKKKWGIKQTETLERKWGLCRRKKAGTLPTLKMQCEATLPCNNPRGLSTRVINIDWMLNQLEQVRTTKMQYRKPRKGGDWVQGPNQSIILSPIFWKTKPRPNHCTRWGSTETEAWIESRSNAERRKDRKRGPRANRSKRVKNSSCCRYLNLAGAGQPGRNATNRERLMGRKHRLEAIAQVGNDWAGGRVRSWTRSLGCRWVGRTRRWIQEAGRPSSASRRRGRGDWWPEAKRSKLFAWRGKEKNLREFFKRKNWIAVELVRFFWELIWRLDLWSRRRKGYWFYGFIITWPIITCNKKKGFHFVLFHQYTKGVLVLRQSLLLLGCMVYIIYIC